MKPGDVFALASPIGDDIPAGVWCLLSFGWLIELQRVGEDEDGHPVLTWRTAKVTFTEFADFIPAGFNLFAPMEEEEA